MKPSVLDALIAAKQLISNESNWATRVFATDRAGNMSDVFDPISDCFCAEAAVAKVSCSKHDEINDVYVECINLLQESIRKIFPKGYQLNVIWFNDHCTHSELMQVFDSAIAAAGVKVMPIAIPPTYNKIIQ